MSKSRSEALNMVIEVLNREFEDPADEIIKFGKAIMGIGEAVKGMTSSDARKIILAAKELN